MQSQPTNKVALTVPVNHPLSRNRDVGRQITRSLAIANDYRDENTVQLIADTYNVSTTTVHRIARQFGLRKRKEENAEKKKIRDAAIIERLKTKLKLKEIAEEFGLSIAAISLVASRNGLRRKRKEAQWVGKEEAIAADYKAGEKMDYIEAKWNIDRNEVYRLLARLKIKPNRMKRKK